MSTIAASHLILRYGVGEFEDASEGKGTRWTREAVLTFALLVPLFNMAKGSQLSQLKSALSQAGITRQDQPSKKRKRTAAASQQSEREKKSARLKDINERLNPFDVQVSKLKHDVGGRKIRGVSGKPAQSKQTGLEHVRTVQPNIAYADDAWLAQTYTSSRVSGQESCGRRRRSSVRRE